MIALCDEPLSHLRHTVCMMIGHDRAAAQRDNRIGALADGADFGARSNAAAIRCERSYNNGAK